MTTYFKINPHPRFHRAYQIRWYAEGEPDWSEVLGRYTSEDHAREAAEGWGWVEKRKRKRKD